MAQLTELVALMLTNVPMEQMTVPLTRLVPTMMVALTATAMPVTRSQQTEITYAKISMNVLTVLITAQQTTVLALTTTEVSNVLATLDMNSMLFKLNVLTSMNATSLLMPVVTSMLNVQITRAVLTVLAKTALEPESVAPTRMNVLLVFTTVPNSPRVQIQ